MSCTLSAASLAFEEKRKRTAPNSIVRFIVAPLGSFGDDWRAHQQSISWFAIRMCFLIPTVFAALTMSYSVRRAGPHKLLFGSDGPWLHPGLELHKIKLLGLQLVSRH